MKQHNRIHFFLQNEARKLNHQEVAEEDRRSKLPKNFEARKRQLDWEEEQETKKQVGVVQPTDGFNRSGNSNHSSDCCHRVVCHGVVCHRVRNVWVFF